MNHLSVKIFLNKTWMEGPFYQVRGGSGYFLETLKKEAEMNKVRSAAS